MAADQADYGLLIKGKNASLPLKDVSVSAFVQGYLLGLQSVLKYENSGSDPVEVLFRTPVDDSHAVVGLEAVIDGRRIRAEIKEKEQAKQEYDDAIASGMTAAFGEEKKGDIFSLALGNLPPGKEAEIHLTMVGELGIDAEGSVRFSLPAVLKPRYSPTGSEDPLAPVTGGETPAGQVHHSEAPSVYKFELNIAGAERIAEVTSPSHKIRSSSPADGGGVLKVQLDQDGPVTKDIVILIKPKDPHRPLVVVESGVAGSPSALMGSPAVMVSFFPEIKSDSAEVACEFVFVVDRSGSMSGSYIREAAETMVLFLKSIPEGCTFNIIGFGSSYEKLFPKSVPYTQENLDKAVGHVEHLQANLGGTELYPPLEYIFKQPLDPHLTRQVFVLTDGSVSNTEQVIQLVRKNASRARCFSFGIGSGASTHLVKGIAQAGLGTAEFITSGERMQPKVIRSLKNAMQPAVTNARVHFGLPVGYSAKVAPEEVPPIFFGECTIVYGILQKRLLGKVVSGSRGTVTLEGELLGEKIKHVLEFEVPGLGADVGAVPTIHHLAGKALIKGMQNMESSKKDEIVKLSCECSVISKHTAFIAIDEEQKEPVKGSLQTWDVVARPPPMMATYDWQSVNVMPARTKSKKRAKRSAHGVMSRSAMPEAIMSRKSAKGSARGVISKECAMDSFAFDDCLGMPPPVPSGFGGGVPPPPPGSGSVDLLCTPPPKRVQAAKSKPSSSSSRSPQPALPRIISLQRASGAWKLSAELAGLLGRSLDELKAACPATCEGELELVWATVLVLGYLEKKLLELQNEWELIAMKAKNWLKKQHVPEGHSTDSFLEKAKTAV